MTTPDGQDHPVLKVRIRQRANIATVLRGQTWFWETIGENNKRMARSKGYFTNHGDCADNIVLHFGPGTTVIVQEAEHGNTTVRWGRSD